MPFLRPVVAMGVDSQLTTLERTGVDERPLTADIASPVAEIVDCLAERMTDA